ncbi:hypothetical protein AAHB43_09010 [Staphylococcus pseudintermedius]
MFEEKHLWQTSFLWMRYLNYDCVHYEKDKNEVWLAHKKGNMLLFLSRGRSLRKNLISIKIVL